MPVRDRALVLIGVSSADLDSQNHFLQLPDRVALVRSTSSYGTLDSCNLPWIDETSDSGREKERGGS